MNYLIVGLGNIGVEYENTRHNMGFMILDAFAKASNVIFENGRYGSTATISHKGQKFILLKPSTYMNLSGKADLNIPFGTLRLRKNGSAGGHNGLTNITEMLGTQEYARMRVGIGNDFNRGAQVNFVLGELSSEEQEEMKSICERAVNGIKTFALAGPDKAMNIVNTKVK